MAVKKSKKTDVKSLIKGYINVIKERYHIRFYPSKRADSLEIAHDGEVYAWTGEIVKGWYKIVFAGTICYLPVRAAIGHMIEEQSIYFEIKKDGTKLRIEPSAKALAVFTLDAGDSVVNLCEKRGSWLKVLYDCDELWVSEKAVK